MTQKKKAKSPKSAAKKRGKTELQGVIFDKSEWTIAKAKDWLKAHNMKAPAAEKFTYTYHFKQADKADFKKFRAKIITPSITFVFGIK